MEKVYVVVANCQGLTESVHTFRDEETANDEKEKIRNDYVKTYSDEDEVIVTVHETVLQ